MTRTSSGWRIEPALANGLQEASQVLIDKITTVPASKVRQVIGHADDTLMIRVNRALVLFLGVASSANTVKV